MRVPAVPPTSKHGDVLHNKRGVVAMAPAGPSIVRCASSRILGRVSAGTGPAEELTGENVRTVCGLATTDTPTLAGLTLTGAQAIVVAAATHAMRIGPEINTSLGLSAVLTIDGTGTVPLALADFRAGVNGPALLFYKSRGLTAAGRTATQASDQFLFLMGSGRGATIDHYNKGGIIFSAGSNWTDTSTEIRCDFVTTPSGSITRVTRMSIIGSGEIGMGTEPTAGNGKAQFPSAGTTQADGIGWGDVFLFRGGSAAARLTGSLQVSSGLGMFGATPPAQATGFGTPTGATRLSNFPGATATLAQCSGAIADLLTYLKSRGDLGA